MVRLNKPLWVATPTTTSSSSSSSSSGGGCGNNTNQQKNASISSMERALRTLTPSSSLAPQTPRPKSSNNNSNNGMKKQLQQTPRQKISKGNNGSKTTTTTTTRKQSIKSELRQLQTTDNNSNIGNDGNSEESVKVAIRMRPLAPNGDQCAGRAWRASFERNSIVEILNNNNSNSNSSNSNNNINNNSSGGSVCSSGSNHNHHPHNVPPPIPRTPRTPRTPSRRTRGRKSDDHEYNYDKVFGEDTNTCEIYNELVADLVESVTKQGVNGTVFTYGQTSSGKTFTMQGCPPQSPGDGDGGRSSSSSSSSSIGIIQLAAQDIFQTIKEETRDDATDSNNSECSVSVSYVEIYNEELRDLLNGNHNHHHHHHHGSHRGSQINTNNNNSLIIREDKHGSISVEGLKEIRVNSLDELMDVFRHGEANKSVGSTKMNDRSSRSHAILKIIVERKTILNTRSEVDDLHDKENVMDKKLSTTAAAAAAGGASSSSSSSELVVKTSSALNLVDLAGSESVRHTGASGMQKKEGGMINQSLLTLSKVLMSLGQKNPGHINYRDSKLTRILKPSLSGNARMAVICCISPSTKYIEETRSTLQFATRAKLVKTNAVVNEVVDNDSDLIAKVRLESAKLKMENQKLADRLRRMEEEANSNNAALLSRLQDRGDGACDDDDHPPYHHIKRELDNLKKFVFGGRPTKAAAASSASSSSQSNDVSEFFTDEHCNLRSIEEATVTPLDDTLADRQTSKDDLHILPTREIVNFSSDGNIFRAALEFKAQQVKSLQARLGGSNSGNQMKSAKEKRYSSICEMRSPDADRRCSMMNELWSPEMDRRVSGIDMLRSPDGDALTPGVDSKAVRELKKDKRYSSICEMRSPDADRRMSGIDMLRSPVDDRRISMVREARTPPVVDKAESKLESTCHDAEYYRAENEQLESKLADANGFVTSLERQVEELTSQKYDALDWIEELYAKSDEKDEKTMQACEARDNVIKRCEALESELMNTKELLRDTSMDLEQSTFQNQELRLGAKVASTKINSMETEIDSLKSAHNDCAYKVEELYEDLEKAKEKYEAAQDTLRQLRISERGAAIKVGELEAEIVHLTSERDKLSTAALSLAESSTTPEGSSDLEKANEDLKSQVQELDDLRRALIEQVEKYEEELTDADALLKTKEDELDDAMFTLDKEKKQWSYEKKQLTEKMNNEADNMKGLEDVEALKSELDVFQMTLNTKVTELQHDLDITTHDNEVLMKKLKEISEELEVKVKQIESLEHAKGEALNQLELAHKKSNADLESFEFQEEILKAQIKKGLETIKYLQDKVPIVDEELKKKELEHSKSKAAFNTQIAELQKDLDTASNENESLRKKLKNASDDLDAKQAEMEQLDRDKSDALKKLDHEKSGALKKLELAHEKSKSDLESFKLQEEVLEAQIKKGEETIQSLQGRAPVADKELEKKTEEHNESTTASNTKIAELQKDLDIAMKDNEALLKKLKNVTDDLDAKQAQIEILDRNKSDALEELEHARSDALNKLELAYEKSESDLESFKLKEETLESKIKKGEETIQSLQGLKKKSEEYDKSAAAFNTKLAELQKDLDTAMDDLDAKQAQLDNLDRDKSDAMKKLELAQENIETLRRALKAEKLKGEKALDSLQGKVDSVKEEELKKITKEHKEHTAALNAKILSLQKALDVASHENESRKIDLETKTIQMESLEHRTNEALQQLSQSQEQYNSEVVKGEEMVKSLRAEAHRQLLDAKKNEATRVDHEVRGLRAENERLRATQHHLTKDFDECCKKMDDLVNELSRTQMQLKCAKKEEGMTEGRLINLEKEKSELANDLNTADAKIKELFARVQNAKKEVNVLQKANTSLNARDQELRVSISRIQQLAEALSSENANLKEKIDSDKRARECLENRSRELQCLLSTSTSERDVACDERDNLAKSNANLLAKSRKLSNERDIALREKEMTRLKLDKIAASFEADYETVRAKTETLLREKNDLQGKITFLEASKASVETNADRILQRDNAIAGQHDRLKTSFKMQTMKLAELQDEVNQLVKRLAQLKEENFQLSRENRSLKDNICSQASEVQYLDEPSSKKRAVFGFRK